MSLCQGAMRARLADLPLCVRLRTENLAGREESVAGVQVMDRIQSTRSTPCTTPWRPSTVSTRSLTPMRMQGVRHTSVGSMRFVAEDGEGERWYAVLHVAGGHPTQRGTIFSNACMELRRILAAHFMFSCWYRRQTRQCQEFLGLSTCRKRVLLMGE